MTCAVSQPRAESQSNCVRVCVRVCVYVLSLLLSESVVTNTPEGERVRVNETKKERESGGKQ